MGPEDPKYPGIYTVRVSGHEDRKCDFETAVRIISSVPRGTLLDPHGEVILTKGEPPEPSALP